MAKSTELIYPFNTTSFIQIWDTWKAYKLAEHKDKYKSIFSEQMALKKLAELCNNDENTAKEYIENAIARSWKGVFAPQQNTYARSTNHNNKPASGISLDTIDLLNGFDD